MAENTELKLKNVSNPLELLASLKTIVDEGVANSAAVNKIKQVHETLEGTQYTKVFTDLNDCTLESGSSNLSGGYLYC